jgi:hypothetical protein
MEPLIADGTCLVFDSRAPVAAGDVVAIWLDPRHVWPGDPQQIIKRLVTGLPPLDVPLPAGASPIVVAETLNPPRLLHWPAEQVLAIHKCVGTAEGSGPGKAQFRPNDPEHARLSGSSNSKRRSK